MRYVLGIDAGGTKTVGLLADEQGRLVAEARGGGANLQTQGELEVEKVFDGMTKAFLPDKAHGQAAIIQWDIKTPKDTVSYQITVEDGKCAFVKGA